MAEEEKFRWDDERVAHNQAFEDLLGNKELRDEIFNEKFAEGLERRLDKFQQDARRSQQVQMTAMGLLVIALLVGDLTVSIFGISAKPFILRELLLVVGSGCQLYRLLDDMTKFDVIDALAVYVKKAGWRGSNRIARTQAPVRPSPAPRISKREGQEADEGPNDCVCFDGGRIWKPLPYWARRAGYDPNGRNNIRAAYTVGFFVVEHLRSYFRHRYRRS